MKCGKPTKRRTPCKQNAPCPVHGPEPVLSRIGNEARRRYAGVQVYVRLSSRQTVVRTLQAVAEALAARKMSDKPANVIVRACAERIRMFDLRLQEREERLAKLEAEA